MSARASSALAALAAGLPTLVVGLSPLSEFVSRNPALHVAVETAAALISLVAAQLMYGRFRQGYQLRDLLLTMSLGIFAVANLAFSLVPAVADAEDGPFASWAGAGGRLLGAALLALAALVPDRALHRPRADLRRAVAASALALGALALAVAIAGDALHPPVSPRLSPARLDHLRLAGNPAIMAAHVLVAALFAVAAVGFTRRADRSGDELARWLAIAATLGVFSRLNFLLFPSLYTPYFSLGDLLRLGFFIALLVGGALELRRARDALAAAAVLEERQRIARDIHDGVAQDLAYILQQGRRLAAEPGASVALRHVSSGGGDYIYNMQVNLPTLNTDYTVVVYPYGTGSTVELGHVIQATK